MVFTSSRRTFSLRSKLSSHALQRLMLSYVNISPLMYSSQASRSLASPLLCIFSCIRYVEYCHHRSRLTICLQCVVLTVRPVLFSLLKPLLAPDVSKTNTRLSSSPFESMLKMCIESAVQILKIMAILRQQMMCGRFSRSLTAGPVLTRDQTYFCHMTLMLCSQLLLH